MKAIDLRILSILISLLGCQCFTSDAAQAFGFMPTGAPVSSQVIDPQADGTVRVGWVGRAGGRNRVYVANWSSSSGFGEADELYSTTRQIWGLKLETTPGGESILCVLDGPYGAYRTRVIKHDKDHHWVAQNQWNSDVNVLPKGRMLGGEDQMILSRARNTASARYLNTETMAAAPWFVVQLERPPGETFEEYIENYYEYSYKLPPKGVSSIDTAISKTGAVTALYDFGGIRMKKYAPDGSVTLKMRIDGRPYSGLEKLAKASVDVLDDETTLLAWEWHNYYFNGASLVMFSAENFFRGIRADGSVSPSIRLHPASTKPDIQDTPSVALREDGSGAVAWTVRSKEGAAVWLQRLDSMLEPREPPRLVDARLGYRTDQPMLRSDGGDTLYLSWRCTSTTGGLSEIALLSLNELDSPPALPSVAVEGENVRLSWVSPPACQTTLWHSTTPNFESAEPICTEQSIGGDRTMIHERQSEAGFYWLSVD